MISNKTMNELLTDQDVENRLREYIDNKDIAVIGNAKKLLDYSYGNEIDLHEVVIRMNRGFLLASNQNYKVTHGNKIDLLMVNLIHTINNFPSDCFIPYKVIQTTTDNPKGKLANKVEFSLRDVMMKPLLDKFAPLNATTGLRVLHLVSLLNPKSVSVYGYDWKQESPTFYGNDDNWHMKGHDYPREKEYCYNNFFSKTNWNHVV